MRIAATYEDKNIFAHFGHTQTFKVYEVEDGAVKSARVVPTQGSGHGALAGFLQGLGVTDLICGGIGGGAQQALAEAGIRLHAGVSGDADTAAAALVAGTLVAGGAANCDHHGEGEGAHAHGCGGSCHS